MTIRSAKFVVSNTDVTKCPKTNLPEYAFIGRSNVGKSSLINMLTGNKKLAKISGQPGKTQLINHFIINDSWYLVDLPGYGFAKASKQKRNAWMKMINKYLGHRQNLTCLFVLIDSRLKPQAIDIEFIINIGKNSVPFAIAFTKTDKLSKHALQKNIEVYKNELYKTWEQLPEIFISSSRDFRGKEQILGYIETINNSSNNGQ